LREKAFDGVWTVGARCMPYLRFRLRAFRWRDWRARHHWQVKRASIQRRWRCGAAVPLQYPSLRFLVPAYLLMFCCQRHLLRLRAIALLFHRCGSGVRVRLLYFGYGTVSRADFWWVATGQRCAHALCGSACYASHYLACCTAAGRLFSSAGGCAGTGCCLRPPASSRRRAFRCHHAACRLFTLFCAYWLPTDADQDW